MGQKKHLLFFNDGLELGGTEILLIQILEHLSSEECNVTLLLPRPSMRNVLLEKVPSSVSIKYLENENGSYIKRKINENILIFFPRIYLYLKSIRQEDFDIVVCFKECFYAKMFSVMNICKILWIHNILYKKTYNPKNLKDRLVTWLNKKHVKNVYDSYKKFDEIICVSEACKNAYINIVYDGNNTQPTNLRILYNAIDLTKIKAKAAEKIYSLPQDRTNFVLLTRTSPEKRNDRLIYAAQKLNADGYNFHVYILGENIEEQFNDLLESDRTLKGKLTFTGRVNNPYPYLLQAKWALCVSERESFGLTLLEAMAVDTPVITTNCGGPNDIIDNGKYGMLVENSTKGVYNGMKAVLDDPSLTIKYSSNLKNAVQRFDYQHWLYEIDRLLKMK